MKKRIFTCLAACMATVPMLAAYQLVWSDEFNGTSLNTDVWNYELGVGTNCDGNGNWERQEYVNDANNIYVSDGNLVIKATYDNHTYVNGTCSYGAYWKSARINTKNKVKVRYGKIEARIKLPAMSTGVFPAFWMLGSNYDGANMNGESNVGWPRCGEIDIMEQMGSNYSQGGKITPTTLHWYANGNADYGGSLNVYGRFGTMPADAYFIYGVEWTPNNIVGYVCDGDGNNYTVVPNRDGGTGYGCPDAMKRDFFLLLNLAMGGTAVNEFPDQYSAATPTMYVDWVRIYQDDSRNDNYLSAVEGGGDTDTEKPSAPANLTVNAAANSVGLTWTASTDNVGVTGYNIYVNGTKVGSSNTTSYTVTGLQPETTYQIAVEAYDAAGNTSNRATRNVSTTEGASTPCHNTFSAITASRNVVNQNGNWNQINGLHTVNGNSVTVNVGNANYANLYVVLSGDDQALTAGTTYVFTGRLTATKASTVKIYIESRDNNEVQHLFDNNPITLQANTPVDFSFEATNPQALTNPDMTISIDNGPTNTTYTLTDISIREKTCANNVEEALPDAKPAAFDFKAAGGEGIIRVLYDGSCDIVVRNITGKVLATRKEMSGNLTIHGLEPGIYLVTACGVTHKVVVR